METSLKQRLLGASLVIALSVVFVPMLIDTDDTLSLDDKALPNTPTFTTDDELPNLNEARARVAALPAAPPKAEVADDESIDDEPDAHTSQNALLVQNAENTMKTNSAVVAKIETPAPSQPTVATEPEQAQPVLSSAPAAKPVVQAVKPAASKPAKVENVIAAKASPVAAKLSGAAWAVQVATFANKENAQVLVNKLKHAGMAAYMRDVSGKGRTLVRVYLGPELDKNKASLLQAKLDSSFHLKGMIVAYRTN